MRVGYARILLYIVGPVLCIYTLIVLLLALVKRHDKRVKQALARDSQP